ncbi:hypothetical protein U9M48_031004 [Paspalum notatum var. saurae]|uniref:Retrotransposon gag domain-containing protein n=1 Tax=Paspalum notatum var. saurae TaxID=547442 RepID=A0AAQ3U1S9_PASNO
MVRISDIHDGVAATEEVTSLGSHASLHGSDGTARTPRAPRRPAIDAVAANVAVASAVTANDAAANRAAARGPLAAAMELLNHPPGPAASPNALAQWRSDVDRLIHLAEAAPSSSRARSRLPPSNGGRSDRHGPHDAAASVRSPTVRSAPTKDLRAKLNRRRAGTHTTVEQPRLQPNAVKGKKLDAVFAAAAPRPPGYAQAPAGAQTPPGVIPAGVGCSALADGLRSTRWPPKFRPHLPEKYDGTTNPSEFLQVYVTAISTAGGDDAVMASYFHVALSELARTYLTPGSIRSWEELCTQFIANFASACQQYGVEAHLHAVRQEPGEPLRAFIARFAKVRGTIPRISDASIITAFRQGVRDEKMLEKLATRQVQDVAMLYALADKCAKAAEGRAWHSPQQNTAAQAGGSAGAAREGSKKKKKGRRPQRSLEGAPVAAAAPGGRDASGKCPRQQARNSSGSCPVHPNSGHSAADCREIQKLVQRRLNERRERPPRDDSPPRQRPGKGKATSDGGAAAGGKEMGYQPPERELKSIYALANSDSDSSDNERRKKLYVMYGGSWEVSSRRDVKALRREVLSVKPSVPKVAPHLKWRNTTISFGPSDCPKNMAGAGLLPIITSPVVANIWLYHVLIDGGAALNIISYAAFKRLQIPSHSRLRRAHSPEWARRRSTRRGRSTSRPALYRFMAVAHYGYLVVKMPSPVGVLTVPGDRLAAVAAVEKLHALAADAAGPEGADPSASGIKAPAKDPKVPKVRPAGPEDVPVKTVQIGAEASRTTRIAGNLWKK